MKCLECDEYVNCGRGNDLRRKRSRCPKAKKPKPITNYDRIISKTPEELAELLDTRECPTARCPNEGEDGCIVPTASCRECWLDWLRQEAAP